MKTGTGAVTAAGAASGCTGSQAAAAGEDAFVAGICAVETTAAATGA